MWKNCPSAVFLLTVHVPEQRRVPLEYDVSMNFSR